jgi:hypothetical protein
MVITSKTGRKKPAKRRVKKLNLKRETIKELSARDQKKIKGAGGLAGGVDSWNRNI